MGDLWLCIGGQQTDNIRPWQGTLQINEDREADYKFKIECKDNMYTLSSGENYGWKLAINESDLQVAFVKRETNQYSTDFKLVMDQTFGEDAFQLHCAWSDKGGNSKKHQLMMSVPNLLNKLVETEKSPKMILIPREKAEKKAAGLTVGSKYYTFIITKKW